MSYFSNEEGCTEEYEYECPCGKGRIVEEHDDIPGDRNHMVYFICEECSNKYRIDTSLGVRQWRILEK